MRASRTKPNKRLNRIIPEIIPAARASCPDETGVVFNFHILPY
ncbi:hypothetical protein [Capillibacterium thermochitinicola]|nr:hypothetical protein [Capillibacterium thermochitinicola]